MTHPYSYVSGQSLTTGLMFAQSWDGCPSVLAAFTEWLQMAYCRPPSTLQFTCLSFVGVADEEKNRREGYSVASLAPTPDPTDDEPATTQPPPQTTPDHPTVPNDPPTIPNEPPAAPNNPLTTPNDPPATPSTTPTVPNDFPTPPDDPPTMPNDSPPMPNDPPPSTPNDAYTSDEPTPTTPSQISESHSPRWTPTAMPRSTHVVSPPTPGTHSCSFEHHDSYPAFITAAVIEHLDSVDGGTHWVGMVRDYLKLESDYPLRVSFYSPQPPAST